VRNEPFVRRKARPAGGCVEATHAARLAARSARRDYLLGRHKKKQRL